MGTSIAQKSFNGILEGMDAQIARLNSTIHFFSQGHGLVFSPHTCKDRHPTIMHYTERCPLCALAVRCEDYICAQSACIDDYEALVPDVFPGSKRRLDDLRYPL